MHGNGTQPAVLDDAGAASADSILAITPHDEDNYLICQAARRKYDVQFAFALVNDPDNEKIFRELGISSAFSPIGILSLLIEQRIGYDAITNLTPLADGKANLTEITPFDAASPVAGKKIQDLDLPESCLIVSVMRDGQVLIPRGGTELRPRDRIGIVSLPGGLPPGAGGSHRRHRGMRGLSGLSRAFPHAREQLRALGFLSLIISAILLTPLLYFLFEPAEAAWRRSLPAPCPARRRRRSGSVRSLPAGEADGGSACRRPRSWWWPAGYSPSCLCAYPFRVLAGLNFTQGVFEAMSGWTTTACPWSTWAPCPIACCCGGASCSWPAGRGWPSSCWRSSPCRSAPGCTGRRAAPTSSLPHVLASTRLVLLLYSGYALAGIVAYRLAGMNWFDAVNHSFAAVSTGGFSTRAQSIGYWDSPPSRR